MTQKERINKKLEESLWGVERRIEKSQRMIDSRLDEIDRYAERILKKKKKEVSATRLF